MPAVPGEIRRHLEHISQPFAGSHGYLCVEMPRGGYAEVKVAPCRRSSVRIRDRVIRAVLRQRNVFAGTGIRYNAGIPPARMEILPPSAKSRNGGWSSCSDVWI